MRYRRGSVLTISALMLLAVLPPYSRAAEQRCHGRVATIVGSDRADRIRGTNDSDIIVGLGGDDRIEGRGGRDFICGGSGADTLSDSGTSDLNDDLDGGTGIDTITGENRVFLAYKGGVGIAGFEGSYGRKTLFNIENIIGTAGNDTFAGSPYRNKINGQEGDDYFLFLSGEEDQDTWIGGPGMDTLDFSRAPAPVNLSFLTAAAAVGGDAAYEISGFEKVIGSYFDDTLRGGNPADEIRGAPGTRVTWDSDVIEGNGGDDTLTSSAGPSHLSGGDGNDLLYSHGFADAVLSGDAGDDQLGSGNFYDSTGQPPGVWFAGTSYYDGGAGNDEVFGSDINNVITGGEGGDGLRGYGGDDVIDGGEGIDGGNGGYGQDTCTSVDVVSYCAQDGRSDDLVGDTPTAGSSADLSLDVKFKERQNDGDAVYAISMSNLGPDVGTPIVSLSFYGKIDSVGDNACTTNNFYQGDVDCSFNTLSVGTTRKFQVVVDEVAGPHRSMGNISDAGYSDGIVMDPDWSNNNSGSGGGGAPALPIVFVPGFLGSDIACGDQELWPNIPSPDFKHMQLASDGVSNSQADGCSAAAAPTGKIVAEDYGYEAAMAFLRSLPRKVFFYGYDWRKSPLSAVTGLDELVETAKSRAGTDKVVLMAHSMGGLVSRAYVQQFPSKVARVVTVGTPYLGAPSPWTALAHGYTDPAANFLDGFIDNDDLKAFAQNATGAYYLYPSEQFVAQIGGWLTYPPVGGTDTLTATEVLTAVDAFGGNSALLLSAYEDHAAFLEVYPTSVPWQMVVSSAVETLLKIDETDPDDPQYVYGNGDGTVPVVSAAMGLVEPGAVHYVCGVEHGAMAGDEKVTRIIKAYLLKGEPVTGRTSRCNLP